MKWNRCSTIAIVFFFFFGFFFLGTMILPPACLAQTAPQVQSSPPDQHATPADQRPTPSAPSAGVRHRRHVRHNRVQASTQPAAAPTSKSDKPAEKPFVPESDKKGEPDNFVSAYGKWTLVLALLALFVVAGIGWMLYLQLQLVAKMLEEMGKSAKDTHDLAAAAKAQSDSTRALAENALDQAKTSTLLAEEFKRSADASKASAESYASMADSTAENLRFTQQNVHLEQRAWVSTLMSLRQFRAGEPILADIVTSNSARRLRFTLMSPQRSCWRRHLQNRRGTGALRGSRRTSRPETWLRRRPCASSSARRWRLARKISRRLMMAFCNTLSQE